MVQPTVKIMSDRTKTALYIQIQRTYLCIITEQTVDWVAQNSNQFDGFIERINSLLNTGFEDVSWGFLKHKLSVGSFRKLTPIPEIHEGKIKLK